MIKEPIINILTRTSNRPNYFKNCIESVKKQTYQNINHIISVDNVETEEYVKNYTNNYIKVKKYIGYIPPLDPIYGLRRPAPYNLYLNDLKNQVKEGWIMFLDDDDMFLSENAIEEIVSNIKSEDDILYWKVKLSDIRYIPEDIFFNENHTPKLNHFSMIGFMFNSKYKNTYTFDNYSGGDFFCANKLKNHIPNKIFINHIYTGLQNNSGVGGLGKQQDI